MDCLKDLPAGLSPQGGGGEEDQAKKAQQAQQEEQMRRDVMSTVLDTAARERCKSAVASYFIVIAETHNPLVHKVSRIALVSPERSRQIETILLRMAQSGQLRGRVSLHSHLYQGPF